MKEFWNVIQAIFAAVGGWLGYFLGGCDGLLYALLAFVVIDYITGIMCAVVDKKLSSEVGFKGIFKKVLIFALVGIGLTSSALPQQTSRSMFFISFSSSPPGYFPHFITQIFSKQQKQSAS